MTQVSKYPLPDKLYKAILDTFFRLIIKLSNKKDVESFLTEFLSPTEKIMLAKRVAIYMMLEKGYDYRTIQETLKVSPPTIAKASTMYKYLGTSAKRIIRKMIKDEQMGEFWINVAEKITGEFAHSAKGGGAWRYLHREVIRKRKERKDKML